MGMRKGTGPKLGPLPLAEASPGPRGSPFTPQPALPELTLGLYLFSKIYRAASLHQP